MTAEDRRWRTPSGASGKQRWAVPGSAHDRLVSWSKIVLPSAVGVLIAVLALAPLGKKSDVSFILDKKKVQNAPERMRVEQARYVGTDNKGQQFTIVANRAIQRSSDVPIVDITRHVRARLNMAQGPAADRREPGPLQSRFAEGDDRRPGEGRRAPTAIGSRPAT